MHTHRNPETGGRLGVDATPKTQADATPTEPVRAWPPAMTPDVTAATKINSMWNSLGIRER